jgi:hypothetical protein
MSTLTWTCRYRSAPAPRARGESLLDRAAGGDASRRGECHSAVGSRLQAAATCLTAAREVSRCWVRAVEGRGCHSPLSPTRGGPGTTSRCPWNATGRLSLDGESEGEGGGRERETRNEGATAASLGDVREGGRGQERGRGGGHMACCAQQQ